MCIFPHGINVLQPMEAPLHISIRLFHWLNVSNDITFFSFLSPFTESVVTSFVQMMLSGKVNLFLIRQRQRSCAFVNQTVKRSTKEIQRATKHPSEQCTKIYCRNSEFNFAPDVHQIEVSLFCNFATIGLVII